MKNQILIAAFTFLFIFSCTGQKKSTDAKTVEGKTTQELTVNNIEKMSDSNSQINHIFNEGENKFLKDAGMNITFKKIVEDSRCPKDVQCVWAGVATIELTVMGTYSRPAPVKISTLNDAKKGLSNSVILNGHKISLVELNPYPKTSTDKRSNIGKNQIKLQVMKIAKDQQQMNVK